ncbi:MAG: manganese ABC transporter ATP-binding protein [Zetaproteobacteria bacterium]|nr:MAG: manganese ABC transporter ATP-binding protein [Zetaproteobacteria bacterium]
MDKVISPLSVEGLSCRYTKQESYALRDISFTAHTGTITGVLGPNGAGKSTFLKSILDLLPHEGNVKFFGDTIEENRQKIAYIPQRSSVDWDFPVSALDVCLMGLYPRIGWLKRIRKTHKEEAMHYLEKVKLQDFAHRQIGALSGGQQQRVFMARALAQKADLFLLDEPMAGVDQKTQTLLFRLFKDLKMQGKTMLIIHHNLQAASEHFDHILLLNQVLISQGTPENALSQDSINRAYSPIEA